MREREDREKTIQAARTLKERLGSELLILGHYYQHADNLALADVIGDSYQLSVAASRSQARCIVFCGVHFMAESAAILARPGQRVFLPDHAAGCPLADMITPEGFGEAMEDLASLWGEAPIPVLYVNSTAELKALAGEAGGACCTSSNAAAIVARLLSERRRVLFLPDENLAWNVAASLGEPVATWQGPALEAAGTRDSAGELRALRSARIAAWRGFCPIHQCLTVEDVEKARADHPGCRVLVHPECRPEVVRLSDFTGSTSQLLQKTQKADPGSTLVIGTETTFVRWLSTRRPGVTVVPLGGSFCRNMAKITPEKLRDTLAHLVAPGQPASAADGGEVIVPEAVRSGAFKALRRMIDYTEASHQPGGVRTA